jgi:4-hydroxy-3-methylbut-2-enyl diphosphate reductase
MLKSETEEIQRRVRQAVLDRDTEETNFKFFDTICGATQERQDALFEMLRKPMDALLVVGGYNSSNTSHLVEIAEKELPTFFVRNASCLEDLEALIHYDLHAKAETRSAYPTALLGGGPATIGVTAGASCPSNLIEQTIFRIFEMRGIDADQVREA